jgi:hypothetical protein
MGYSTPDKLLNNWLYKELLFMSIFVGLPNKIHKAHLMSSCLI